MVRAMTKPGRNDPCPCGSGKKYKHCCERKVQAPLANANTALIPDALQTAIQHHQNGRLPQAQALYQQILQADPNHPDALHLLGLIEHQQGNSATAIALIKQAITTRPADPAFHFNLGVLYLDLVQPNEAIACFRQTLLRQPESVDALFALGNALKDQGRFGEAVEIYRRGLVHKPNDAMAHGNLGFVLHSLNKPDEAIASYRQALLIDPAMAGINTFLGDLLLGQGHLDEAVASYRQALELEPGSAVAYSDLLFAMQSLSTCLPAELFGEHQRYAARFEAPLKPFWQPQANNRDPERRLKVAYVSGDFCNSSVAYFLEPILTCHDKARFEIYGYHNFTARDRGTDRIAAKMDHFVGCTDLSDEQLAQRIRADGIDILVDLSGHTARNRLPVFARKPAPVQATYIGYPGSTGLTSIDYRISDPWQDPVGLTERYHSETLVRIAGGMAFAPEPNAPEVNALPALSSGELVFACLNNLSKVNPAVINLWARILQALPQARLMVGNVMNSGIRQRLVELFSQAGIAPERLILQPRVGMDEYLALHHQIDIALDPFPYNGGTTTMHSLWMGVPVITLAGEQPVARLCAAHLSRVSLEEFVAHSEDAYLQCAIRFANDLPALNAVRHSLRARMTAPQCQPATITRQLEAAYREMWQSWCTA